MMEKMSSAAVHDGGRCASRQKYEVRKKMQSEKQEKKQRERDMTQEDEREVQKRT